VIVPQVAGINAVMVQPPRIFGASAAPAAWARAPGGLVGLAALALAGAIALPVVARAYDRGANLAVNPGFEQHADGRAIGWSTLQRGYELVPEGRDGGWCVKCESATGDTTLGAGQTITFAEPVQHPLLFSAWSRTTGTEGYEFSVYLDVHYADGTATWGRNAHCPRDAREWSRVEGVFTPEKPVVRIGVFVSFQKTKGTAWFDDVSVSLAPHEIVDATVLGGVTGDGRIEARAAVRVPSAWTTEIIQEGRVVHACRGEGLSQRISWDGRDAAGRPVPPGPCTVRFTATDSLRGETAVLLRDVDTTGAQPGRSYAIWTETSMTRVMPTDLPARLPPPAAVSLTAARNEHESGQIVFLPPAGAALRDVRLTLPDLVGPDGGRIAAKHLRWHQVGYVRVEVQANHPHVPRHGPCWWPDPLLPVERFDVEPGWAQPVWVTVFVPAGTPPGRYSGEVTISAAGNPDARVPIEVTVHGFTVPVEGHLKTAFALMEGFLEKVYGREGVTPELRRAYGDFLLAHRLNPDDITRTDLPVIEDLVHYRDRGLTAFNVLNMVKPRGTAAWNCFSPVDFYTPEFREEVVAKLDPYVAELKRRGLSDRAYVYSFDERPAEYEPVIREYFGMIKQRYGLPTLTTAKIPQDPRAMRELNVDWLCPVSDVYSFADAERCRADGLQVWSYVCLGPRFPHANFLVDDPLIEARVIIWQAFHQKLDGFLYWGLNVWERPRNDKPIDPARGPKLDWSITTNGMPFLHGDGVLLYPLPDGPAGSIRLANLRDGLEDYEYLWALGRARGDVWSARADCEPVTRALTTFTRDPAVLQRVRERVARELD